MKIVTYTLIIIGLALLAVAIFGKLIGNPHKVLGSSPLAAICLANAVLSIGIICKLFEKK